MTGLLRASGISKQFGGLLAIDNVSLDVAPASITSIIGPNGAGKTTLFNCLTSFVTPSAGEIWLGDTRIDGLRPDLVAAQGVARTYQNIRLFPDLTALENIMVGVDAKRPESLLGALLSTPAHRRTVGATTARANQLLQEMGLAGAATGWRGICRMATSAASKSPAPWPSSPCCCCWTSPPPA